MTGSLETGVHTINNSWGVIGGWSLNEYTDEHHQKGLSEGKNDYTHVHTYISTINHIQQTRMLMWCGCDNPSRAGCRLGATLLKHDISCIYDPRNFKKMKKIQSSGQFVMGKHLWIWQCYQQQHTWPEHILVNIWTRDPQALIEL